MLVWILLSMSSHTQNVYEIKLVEPIYYSMMFPGYFWKFRKFEFSNRFQICKRVWKQNSEKERRGTPVFLGSAQSFPSSLQRQQPSRPAQLPPLSAHQIPQGVMCKTPFHPQPHDGGSTSVARPRRSPAPWFVPPPAGVYKELRAAAKNPRTPIFPSSSLYFVLGPKP
jgi:hypothetical protein